MTQLQLTHPSPTAGIARARSPYEPSRAELLPIPRWSILSTSSVPGDREDYESGTIINDDTTGLDFN